MMSYRLFPYFYESFRKLAFSAEGFGLVSWVSIFAGSSSTFGSCREFV